MVYIIKSESYRLLDNKIKELTDGIDKENITHFDLTIDTLKDIIEECNYTSLFNDKKAISVAANIPLIIIKIANNNTFMIMFFSC